MSDGGEPGKFAVKQNSVRREKKNKELFVIYFLLISYSNANNKEDDT